MTATSNTKMHVHRKMVQWCQCKLEREMKTEVWENFQKTTKEEKQHIENRAKLNKAPGISPFLSIFTRI